MTTLRSNAQSFIEHAKSVHGDKYSYDKAEYVNSYTKITITCPVHGDFQQKPQNHKRGQGCPKCRDDSKRSNTEEFIEKAQFVHGDKYSYDKVEYVKSNQKITITCPIHGDFQQAPDKHLSGRLCPRCSMEYKNKNLYNKKTKISFIEQAKLVHSEKYSYDKADYIGAKSKLTITCPKHGDFEQSPGDHLNGQGCPTCTNHLRVGYYDINKEEYKEQPAIFYHVKFTVKETDESFEKIGITTRSVKDRFNQINKDHELKLEVIGEYPTTLYEAIQIEQDIKQHLLDNNLAYRVHTLKQYNLGGWTECFRCGDLNTLFNG